MLDLYWQVPKGLFISSRAIFPLLLRLHSFYCLTSLILPLSSPFFSWACPLSFLSFGCIFWGVLNFSISSSLYISSFFFLVFYFLKLCFFSFVSRVYVTACWRIFMSAASKFLSDNLTRRLSQCWHLLIVSLSMRSPWILVRHDFHLKPGHFVHCVIGAFFFF